MKPITAEWVAKAEADFLSASREIRVRESPNFDGVCFHAQQCAEKYLKAVLIENNQLFPKTHDLSALLDLLAPLHPEWKTYEEECDSLTDKAVEVRYPGFTAGEEEALSSLDTARRIRAAVRCVLGLDPPHDPALF